jgi:hypothetical protein
MPPPPLSGPDDGNGKAGFKGLVANGGGNAVLAGMGPADGLEYSFCISQ